MPAQPAARKETERTAIDRAFLVMALWKIWQEDRRQNAAEHPVRDRNFHTFDGNYRDFIDAAARFCVARKHPAGAGSAGFLHAFVPSDRPAQATSLADPLPCQRARVSTALYGDLLPHDVRPAHPAGPERSAVPDRAQRPMRKRSMPLQEKPWRSALFS